MSDNILENCLIELGLNKTERIVLSFLIHHGPTIGARIAKETRLKRTSVYTSLESLEQLGVVTKKKTSGATIFSTVQPSALAICLREKAEHQYSLIKGAAKRLDHILSGLPSREELRMSGFEISTFQTSKTVLKNVEKSFFSGDFFAFFDPQLIPEDQLKGAVTRFLKNSAKDKPRIQELIVDGPITRWYIKQIKNEFHEYKLLPKATKLPSDIILRDGTVTITRYNRGKELGINIREPNFYNSFLTMFNLLWQKI